MPLSPDLAEQRVDPASSDSAVSNVPTGGILPGRSKYSISVNQFPNDLGSSDLLHYVEFAINVTGKSEFNKTGRTEVKRNPNAAGFTNDELSTVSTVGAGLAAGIVTGGVVRNVLGRFGSTGGRPGGSTLLGSRAAADTAIAGAVGIGAGLAAAGAVNASKLLKPDTTYRISDVIALHVDGPPTVKYGMNYANKELGTLAGLISGSAFDTAHSTYGAGEAAAALGTSLAKLPGAFGTVDLQSALSASSRTSLNPFKEVIFESVDFRSFMFKYRFLPKSKDESEAVKKIINLFKFHMHPEMSEGKLFFIYPSEFQITYYYGSTQNKYFHRMAPCVLEAMDVTYGGEGFSSFKDGNPTEVYMTLTFREREILTKDMIEEGY